MNNVFTPQETVTIRPARMIGAFKATTTTSEESQDEVEITQHPVQRGAAISDHAYKKPSTLNIKCIFNEETGPLTEIYSNLLTLQNAREPFDVVTGKRIYKSMLLKSLGITTDQKTENVLSVNASLQEVIIVDVQLSKVPVMARSKQKHPGKTGATQKTGDKKAIATKTKSISAAGRGRGLFGI